MTRTIVSLYSNLIVLYIDDSGDGAVNYSLISVYYVRLNLVSQHMYIIALYAFHFYTLFRLYVEL